MFFVTSYISTMLAVQEIKKFLYMSLDNINYQLLRLMTLRIQEQADIITNS
jgi:hypothetical protein